MNTYLPVFISIYLWRFGILFFQMVLYHINSSTLDLDIDNRMNRFVIALTHPLLRPMNILKQTYAKYEEKGVKIDWKSVPVLVERNKTQSVWLLNGLNMLTIGVTFPPFAIIACLSTLSG